ncbi:hypothetical protein P7K49_018330 [Saguinus oedipus]|uniref:Platelet-derived growth factor (PDGF) family profile domain-containing protein n=1 Tax=Saguinus oedipus TaxID=9490 RepID=A0ABQ9V545_SAGOE|nr:hypothetical protein P7K49_018330 [Saguinus oedipus]
MERTPMDLGWSPVALPSPVAPPQLQPTSFYALPQHGSVMAWKVVDSRVSGPRVCMVGCGVRKGNPFSCCWGPASSAKGGHGPTVQLVVPFQEVWGRSYCRALERLVDIVSEYPSEVEHMFSPSCVSLLRCTGCCGDENLHCVPVETVNVTMQGPGEGMREAKVPGLEPDSQASAPTTPDPEPPDGSEPTHLYPHQLSQPHAEPYPKTGLLKIGSGDRPSYVELAFSQHVGCECR